MKKMRWFFWTLVMLNAVAAYWFSSAADHRRDASTALTAGNTIAYGHDVPELKLWNEAPAESLVPDDGVIESKGIVEVTPQEESVPEEMRGAPVGQQPLCRLVGPFNTEGLAKVRLALGDQMNEIRVISKEEIVNGGYWLIISPSDTKDAAESVLINLRQREIDSFLITDGEYRNGITLGVFSEKENADSYQENLKKKGVESLLIPRTQVEQRSWLQLSDEKKYAKTITVIGSTLGLEDSVPGPEYAVPCQAGD